MLLFDGLLDLNLGEMDGRILDFNNAEAELGQQAALLLAHLGKGLFAGEFDVERADVERVDEIGLFFLMQLLLLDFYILFSLQQLEHVLHLL